MQEIKTKAPTTPESSREAISKTDFVQSLQSGLAVITSFDNEEGSLTISEVAEKIGVARAKARRLLLTLTHLGYLETKGRKFNLTPKVLDLGYTYLSSLPFDQVAGRYLKKLTQQVNESASIAVLDQQEIVYVAREQTTRIMSIGLGIGTRLPAYATSMGKVLLASLPEKERKRVIQSLKLNALTDQTITDKTILEKELQHVAACGYGIADEELEVGVRSIACPIRSIDGTTIAAINVGCNASRMSREALISVLLPVIKETATQLENITQKLKS